jgi:hypothetical protein
MSIKHSITYQLYRSMSTHRELIDTSHTKNTRRAADGREALLGLTH